MKGINIILFGAFILVGFKATQLNIKVNTLKAERTTLKTEINNQQDTIKHLRYFVPIFYKLDSIVNTNKKTIKLKRVNTELQELFLKIN